MNPQTLNPYVYCMNNPMKYIDPDGETPWDYDWLPDGDVAPSDERLEEYMNAIESGDHNFDEETERRIREWRLKAYYESTRFWSGGPEYGIIEVQGGYIAFASLIGIINTETDEAEFYLSGGFGYISGGQFMGGKANIESFEDYEGPFLQIGGSCGIAGEMTIDPTTGKILDTKIGAGVWGPSLAVGYSISIDDIISFLKKLKFW